MSKLTGSLFYTAPEVIKGDYDEKSDIWSFGIVMYSLLTGSFPFNGKNHQDLYKNIKTHRLDFDQKVKLRTSKRVRKLIRRLVRKTSDRRLSVD